MQNPLTPPEDLNSFVCITEVAEGYWLINELFRRKFGHQAPVAGRHTLALVRLMDGRFLPANYLHFWRQGPLGLLGGSCTDGNIRRSLTSTQTALIRAHGGFMALTMRYAVARYSAEGVEAFFAHCGDALSLKVLREVGFETASPPHLQVWWPRELSPERKAELVAEAKAVGPF